MSPLSFLSLPYEVTVRIALETACIDVIGPPTHLLSLLLNPRLKLFPLGTFAANTLGTALLGTFQVLQTIQHPAPLGARACAVLRGLADGYCGCLTTVSTFAAEVDALDGRRAWIYVSFSWLVSQVLLAVIIGPSIGAGHVSRQITCRYE